MEKTLSVVFSTRNENQEFINHLKQTSGLKEIEIIQYINNGEYSLTELYNRGLKESKNNIVIFSHDDIIFSSGWGKKYLKHFNKGDFGIVGFAGTTHIPESGMWWEKMNLMVGKVYHQQEIEGKTEKWLSKYSGVFPNVIETLMVDGLCFGVDKTKIEKTFDENFKGFHFYDVDFSFSNHMSGVKVGVLTNIDITHKSIGKTNEEWDKNREQFVSKWKLFSNEEGEMVLGLPRTIQPELIHKDFNIKLKKEPKVSIIIPSKDNIKSLEKTIDSIINTTKYGNYQIYIADTGSNDENKKSLKDYIKNKKISLVEYDYYNFAKINNDMVNNKINQDTNILLFVNDDIELINDAISRSADMFQRNRHEVGTIGIRLHFGDNTVQHAGIGLYINQGKQLLIRHNGYQTSYGFTNDVERDVFGNTGAFLMISKELFNRMGGFSEKYLSCFEDVELNLKCVLAGKINFFLGDCVAYHHESTTRGKDPEKMIKEQKDYQRVVNEFFKNQGEKKLLKHLKFIN